LATDANATSSREWGMRGAISYDGGIATGADGTFEHEFQRHVRGMQVGVTTGANAECGDCTLRFIVGRAFI